MPANLSPDYKAAESAFRQAREPEERLRCLREMLRTIPKHKGTEHLQADIKSRIKQLTEGLVGPKKEAARGGPATVIHAEGAAQIALIGPPNSGKSSLHHKLTRSHAHVGPYPFTTQYPQPGMLPYQDIQFQLVDLPPVSCDHPVVWFYNALQPADACLLVVDLSDPDCVGQMQDLIRILKEKKVALSPDWSKQSAEEEEDGDLPDPFSIRLPVLMLVNKIDLTDAPVDERDVFLELTGLRFPVLEVSAHTEEGLERIGPWLFEKLGIVRVYTKVPGRPPDKDRPFAVRRGQTVLDVAVKVHREIAETFRYARLWGEGQVNGQQVGRDYPVSDGDVLEIHS